MLPKEMTIEDAVKEYQDNKTVIARNDGELKIEGVECIDCHEAHAKEKMKYCLCDEGWVCPKCCGHCGWNEDETCTWE